METLLIHMSLTCFLVLIAVCHERVTCSVSSHYELEHGKKIKKEMIYLESECLSILQCAAWCASNDTCQTASYDADNGLCRLSRFRVNGQNNQGRLATNALQWTTLSKIGCLDDWVAIVDACYYFYNKSVTYEEAKDYCAQQSGRLAEPPSFAAFELLRNYTARIGGECHYIGINDIDVEGHLVWTSNGLPVPYTGWDSTIPINGDPGDCICLYEGGNYRWGDSGCAAKWQAICEN